jgi:hypothetical protein
MPIDDQDAPILGLPNELNHLIFEFLLEPVDLFNAAFTCKQFWVLHEQSIKEHKALSSKYLYLNFPNEESTAVWSVLGGILNNPKARYHVRQVQFLVGRQQNYDDSINDLQLAEIFERFGALEGAEAILASDREDDLALRNGSDDPMNALLVRQLPNLRSLSYADSGEGDAFCQFLLETALAFNTTNPRTFLSKLETVHLLHWDTENGISLDWVLYLLSLPSVQAVHGHMVEAEDDFMRPLAGRTLPRSNITTLEFTWSSISCKAFDELLSGIKGLKSFVYEHVGATVGYADYDPRGITAMLLKYAGHSLERIRLEGDDSSDVGVVRYGLHTALFSRIPVLQC